MGGGGGGEQELAGKGGGGEGGLGTFIEREQEGIKGQDFEGNGGAAVDLRVLVGGIVMRQ